MLRRVCFVSAPYVKVYVMEGKRCIGKKKTRTARRTLEPLYQQPLDFKVDYFGKTLQVRYFSCRYYDENYDEN